MILTVVFLLLASSAWLPFGRPAPDLQALFVPPHAPPGRYEVLVSDQTIESLAARLRQQSGLRTRESAATWTIERLEPLDAFGSEGRYDRYRLARLFGARRPQVARGPLLDRGRTIGSLTLIAPFPDRNLDRLEHGTLIVVTVVRTPTANGLDPTPTQVVEFK